MAHRICFILFMAEEEIRICRICFDQETSEKQLITPCKCKGSSKYIHEECLSTWILSQTVSETKKCEVCKYTYNIKITTIQKCDPRESFSQNPHFACYLLIIILITILLMILVYIIVDKGYINPYRNIFYFLGLMAIFILAFICSLSIMIKLIRGLLYVECNQTLKIFPLKNEPGDLNTTIILNSQGRVDSAPNADEEIQRMNN